MQYLILAEVDGIYSERQGEYLAYIRFDCPPFDTLEEAQQTIREICLNSEYKIQDFRIFAEYPTKGDGTNGAQEHDNR